MAPSRKTRQDLARVGAFNNQRYRGNRRIELVKPTGFIEYLLELPLDVPLWSSNRGIGK